jgi:Putative beta-barrel porin-2, OmpL-like. bbp2
MLAIAVVTPLRAFAQTPPPAPEAAPPAVPAEAAPPPAPMPPPPPPPAAVVVETPPAAPVAPPAKTWKDLVTLEGLVDAYYQYNFTGDNSMVPPTNRQFDVNSNTFTLNYAKVGIGISSDNVGLRMDLGYGATGAIVNAANPADASSDPFLVQQAYATVIPVENLTIDFGKFVTWAGAEVIESNKNWLYSRSYLFFNIPLLHTGLRAAYKISDMLTLQAAVVNGWNGVGIAPDISKDKTFGFNASITIPSGPAIYATVYVGKGETAVDPATGDVFASPDTRFVGDLVVAHTIGNLGLNLNVDYVKDDAAGAWGTGFIGGALMARFQVNDHLAVAGRGEYAHVSQAAGDAFQYQEGTVGLAFPMAGRFEARAEARYDHSNQAVFNDDKSQFTGTGAFLAWF